MQNSLQYGTPKSIIKFQTSQFTRNINVQNHYCCYHIEWEYLNILIIKQIHERRSLVHMNYFTSLTIVFGF